MYYSTMLPGRALDLKTYQWVSVSENDLKEFSFKKTAYLRGGKEYTIFKNGSRELAQKMQTLRFVRCKPGEENINAKLTNAQSIEIYEKAISGKESQKEIANKFNVTTEYVSAIKNLRTRVQVTRNHIEGVQILKPGIVIEGTRNKNRKLSAKIAEFIRRDKIVMHLTTVALAKKYCVHKTTINRILNGKMYKTKEVSK